jgi:hypothetical protein
LNDALSIPQPWTLKASPLIAAGGGKGGGMFARLPIRAGDVIVSEVPLIKIERPETHDEERLDEGRSKILPAAVYQHFTALSRVARDEYIQQYTYAANDDLIRQWGREVKSELNIQVDTMFVGRVVAIWGNNSFEATDSEEIFPRCAAKINHVRIQSFLMAMIGD